MERLGQRLCQLREKHQLTHEELANQLSVNGREIELWELGQKRPSINNLKELSSIYAIDLEQLLPNRLLVNIQMSAILKEAEGGIGTLYFKNVSTQPFFPEPIIKNVRIIEIKAGAMKIQVYQNDQLTRHLLSVDDVLGFLEEVN